jgi:uncharacterized protein YnzC (UPF0291/DUF896 family)
MILDQAMLKTLRIKVGQILKRSKNITEKHDNLRRKLKKVARSQIKTDLEQVHIIDRFNNNMKAIFIRMTGINRIKVMSKTRIMANKFKIQISRLNCCKINNLELIMDQDPNKSKI